MRLISGDVLVAMKYPFVLSRNPYDGIHTFYLYTYPLAHGDAQTMRSLFADHIRGDWLEWLYR